MAFGFFRRRQKMVVVIMAVLMISFLIGYQGFRMLTETDPRDVVVAGTSAGDLTNGELLAADSDINLLSRYVHLGQIQQRDIWPTEVEYLNLRYRNERAELAYALLLKEAQEADIIVTEGDIDEFFRGAGRPIGSEQYRAMISAFKAGTQLAEKHLRAAVGRWLRIHKAFVTAMANVPPSEQQLRRLYRDLNEQISLRVVKIEAQKFLDGAAEPSEQQIQAQFNQFRAERPGQFRSVASFGFGYRQPDRARVLYLFVSRDVVERVTRPGGKAALKHFLQNRSRYVKELPVATSQPATSASRPATAAATRPAEVRRVPMKFSEAKQQIIEELKARAVNNKLEDVLARLTALAETYQDSGVSGPNVYEWVKQRMTHSADEALARVLKAVEIRQEPLRRAMDILAEAAQLQAICYPFGKTGQGELAPDVKVTLSRRNITLAEALKQISEQVKWPAVQWTMCEGFEGVIFPVDEEIGLFPIAVKQTELVDAGGLLKDEILSASVTRAWKPLVQLVFPGQGESSARSIKVNQDGPVMQVLGAKSGRLLWRLTKIVPAHVPDRMTEDIRKQVIRDIKTKTAFQGAIAESRKLLAAAKKSGLEAAAAAAGIETETTGPFTRKQAARPQEEILMLAMQRRISPSEALIQMILAKPVDYRIPDVPGIELPQRRLREYLLSGAFALSPKDVEPKAGDAPYPQQPRPVSALELPALRTVLVMERAEFRPAVISDYENQGRSGLLRDLMALQRWEARQTWFRLPDIKQRMNFIAKQR